jgi:phosphoglycolate phosphatase-like HAD superfamily hydrolase
MNNMQRYFIVMDFDGTLAATFDRSPNGMDVKLAYDLAIREVFGQTGHELYIRDGGLRNREPGEVVKSVLQSLGLYTADDARIATENVVRKKLSYLTPEISERWPRLYPGVKDFFKKVASEQLPIDLGIVSSGHNDFINEVFRFNDLVAPDILVTSDILRSRKRTEAESCKPHTYQLAEAHRQWNKANLNKQIPNDVESRNHGKPYMLYIGDDPIKDAGLAERAKIPFLFVPSTAC